MLDQELLDDFLAALEESGSHARNPELRAALGWDEAQYEAVKAELVQVTPVVDELFTVLEKGERLG
jgi:hypothetical protein